MPHPLPTLEAEVQAVAEDESHALSTGDIELYLSLLADDAVYHPPNSSPKSGEALRHWLTEFLANHKVEWQHFTPGETIVGGELATLDYTYAMVSTPKDEGEQLIGYGKGMIVCRREHGTWKIVRNIWNAAPHQRPGMR